MFSLESVEKPSGCLRSMHLLIKESPRRPGNTQMSVVMELDGSYTADPGSPSRVMVRKACGKFWRELSKIMFSQAKK
jgi:hypothetical protein